MQSYQQRIREELARAGRVGMSAAQVEAFMRLEHSTLDGLDARVFRAEVRTAAACVEAAGPADSAALASSFGLSDEVIQ